MLFCFVQYYYIDVDNFAVLQGGFCVVLCRLYSFDWLCRGYCTNFSCLVVDNFCVCMPFLTCVLCVYVCWSYWKWHCENGMFVLYFVCVSRTFYGICLWEKDSVVCVYGGQFESVYCFGIWFVIPTFVYKMIWFLGLVSTLWLFLCVILGWATTFEIL